MRASIMITATCLLAVAPATTALAETIESVCKTAVEAEGGDASGCACLQEEVAGDAALEAELISLADIPTPQERYEAASTPAKAAIDACFSGPAE